MVVVDPGFWCIALIEMTAFLIVGVID